MQSFRIGNRLVGPGCPVFVVAELSGNHGGSFEKAVELVHAVAETGADAVKLQTYTADTITMDCDSELFRIGGGTDWEGETLHSLYAKNATPWEWYPKIRDVAASLGLGCFSSPFDTTAVDFLAEMDVPAFKIASFELVDLPLIRHAASQGKPLLMSTGMASEAEIDDAVQTAVGAGCSDIILLKCTSCYPALPEEMNLRAIAALESSFGLPVGLSDHTTGVAVPAAAVALGAMMVEKHVCLDRADGGAESGFALEPAEFKEMVDAVRVVEQALGEAKLGLTEKEEGSRFFRRSLFAVEDIAVGEVFTNVNVRSIRPGQGLPPRHFDEILGKTARKDISRGTPMSWDLLE